MFDRKNYFYPDLPQGYQISQYKQPIVGEGEVVVDLDGDESVTIGIERLHLEQDAGKSLHDRSPTMSYVDLNRSGVALMEIVSKPDLRSAGEAMAFLPRCARSCAISAPATATWKRARCAPTSMSRCAKPGAPLGTRCEIKNMNSIRFIGEAIEHEARRQIDIIEDGGSIEQETRLFDPGKGETRSMRSKEEAHDYRYFPDPDLLPLELDAAQMESSSAICRNCRIRRRRASCVTFRYRLMMPACWWPSARPPNIFEAVAKGRDAKTAANWVINELFGRLNKEGKDIAASPLAAGQLGAILDLMADGTISGKIAKDVFEIVWSEGGDPRVIVEQRGMKQVTDLGAIEKTVDEIIAKNPDKVADAKANPKAIGWFVGQVMKASGGKASPQVVNELLKKKLGA